MHLSSGYENRRPRIEMIPLIDIVFLLLVFFIYAMLSMVVHRGLKVELPGASTAQVDRRQHVTITLTKDNAVYVDEEPVPLDRLVDHVVARLATSENKDLPVFINGDRKADLGLAVQVLDGLRAAGINEVFITSTEEEE